MQRTIVYLALEQNYKLPKLSKSKLSVLSNQVAFSLLQKEGVKIRHNTVKGIIEYRQGVGTWNRVNDSDLCHLYINVLKDMFRKDYCADWLYAKANK